MAQKTVPLAERFWSKVDVRGPDECWPFTGFTDKMGYGHIWDRLTKKPTNSHRVAWIETNGPIPDGLHVLHHCDHGWCMNPAHLWLGTHQENMRDKQVKGRQPRGELSGHAKLTEAQVAIIRTSPERAPALARQFGVSRSLIRMIRRQERWTYVA